jgi:hypothetical protein
MNHPRSRWIESSRICLTLKEFDATSNTIEAGMVMTSGLKNDSIQPPLLLLFAAIINKLSNSTRNSCLRLKNLDMGGSRRLGHSYMWFSIRTIVGKKCKLKIKGTAIK